MGINALLIIIAVVMVGGLIATLLVGFSSENKKENPEYEQKTGKKLTRLTLIYLITIVLVLAIFLIMLNQ